jgi:dethiobiotin synthetase
MLVVGLTHAADPAAVAGAIAHGLARAERPAVARELLEGRFTSIASPAIAARHVGEELDPAELVQKAREMGEAEVAVLSVPGGLLAPLSARYSVRDLARELGWPIVLVAPSTPDATSLARLGVESCRAVGVPVAAVVLSGWPTPPDRVMIDELRLLKETSPVVVETLSSGDAGFSEAARNWDVAEWIEAMASGPTSNARIEEELPAPPLVLDPYVDWEPVEVGDPRSTPRPFIMARMLEIIEAEGPMLASRAYSLYNKASGGKKLTSIARAPLSSAVHWLAQERKIVLLTEGDIPWQGEEMVRMPDHPPVRVRELGPRDLDEVPLDEIAELMDRLRAAGHARDAAGLKRAVLDTYGLKRLTAKADEYLGLALEL